MRDSSIRAELNEMAQDLVRLGKRFADASRDWLSDRRHAMNRNEDRPFREQDPDIEQRTYGRQGSFGEHEDDRERMRGYRNQGYRFGAERGQDFGAADFGYSDQRHLGDYPRGYDLGRGGPGGYAPRTGGERSYGLGEREFGRGYGGSDYRGETYASEYGDDDSPWREGRYASASGTGRAPWQGPPAGDERFGGGRAGHAGSGYGGSGGYGSSRHAGYGASAGMRGYRGIGPKNYTRSDERIREELCERLTDADDIDARGIEVQVRQGVVTLEGEVGRRQMKYRAEDLAESCSGVRDIENRLRVREDESRGQSRYSPTGREQQQQTEASYGQGQDIGGGDVGGSTPRH